MLLGWYGNQQDEEAVRGRIVEYYRPIMMAAVTTPATAGPATSIVTLPYLAEA